MAAVIDDQFATSSGHWYTRDGEPMYQVVGANGKVRNTTLADARKMHLVPSVSGILALEAKPNLVNWMVQQGMLSCLTLPRLPGENVTEFMKRASYDAKMQSITAAARGTYLHGLLEKAMVAGSYVHMGAEDSLFVLPVIGWINTNLPGYTWNVERSFASPLGYGGKIDLSGTHPTEGPVVLDYKCKDFSEPGKRLHYDEHVTQLAAYAYGLGYPNPRCINLFISSTVPGLFVPHEWESEDIGRGWTAFRNLLGLWKARKNVE